MDAAASCALPWLDLKERSNNSSPWMRQHDMDSGWGLDKACLRDGCIEVRKYSCASSAPKYLVFSLFVWGETAWSKHKDESPLPCST